MSKAPVFFPVVSILVPILILGISSWTSPDTLAPLQQATATSAAPTVPPMSDDDSWIIVDLPPDASQLEYGTEVYRLVCKACHGDKGQGLTDDWRAQWAPEDQNCWQSKCHAANHPPDGFYMPISPAVVGPPVQIFETAQDLYNYIHVNMPWHNRGSMTEKESWSVTAYILKINNIDPGPELGPETAGKIQLRGSSAAPTPQASVIEQEAVDRLSPIWIAAILAVVVLAVFGILPLIRRIGR